jgi:hypothetical protein
LKGLKIITQELMLGTKIAHEALKYTFLLLRKECNL